VETDDDLIELVRARGPALLRYAHQLTHDPASAQDLVQEALMNVMTARRRRPLVLSNPEAYLRRAVTNEYLRRRRLHSSAEIITDAVPDLGIADATGQWVDRDLMWHALGRLSRRQRAVLVLRFYEQVPDRDIAAALDCREASVRSLAARGLRALRDDVEVRAESASGAQS
jgi:RNA polymerase sigma-70 factor (sigma-E family)